MGEIAGIIPPPVGSEWIAELDGVEMILRVTDRVMDIVSYDILASHHGGPFEVIGDDSCFLHEWIRVVRARTIPDEGVSCKDCNGSGVDVARVECGRCVGSGKEGGIR